jgi:hypothetical protein
MKEWSMSISCLSRAAVRLVYAALILLAAGLVAGGVMLVLLIVGDVTMALAQAPNAFRGGWLVGIIAFPFWLLGAFVVGPPLWAALHIARLRGRRTAHAVGALTGGVAVPVVLWLMNGGGSPTLSPDSVGGLAMLSAVAGISGAVAGEALHRLTYRSGEVADAH